MANHAARANARLSTMTDAPAGGHPNGLALTALGVSLLAFVVRLPFIFLFPADGGDSDIYTTVADNILSGCGVSLSTPALGACVPHFGGNQGPGYPFFLAAVWWLTGHSDMAVRLIQDALLGGAIGFAAYAFATLTSRGGGLALGIVLALSPLQLAWPRYLQTETLSLAVVLCFLAMAILSIRDHRLHIVSMGLIVAIGTFIRLDLVVLTIPIAVLAFALHDVSAALTRGMAVAIIVALPWGAWTIRNVAVGLPRLYPTPMTVPDGKRPPLGYANWVRTWLVYEYERPGALWGPNRFVYNDIYIPDRAYVSQDEKQQVAKLLEDLKKHQGEPIPEVIDNAFAKLARNRCAQEPVQCRIVNPAIRAVQLWSNPFSSFGWPNEMPSVALRDEDRLQISKGGLGGMLALAQRFPLHALTKAMTAGYRFGLLAAFLVCCLFAAFRVKDWGLRVLALTVFCFVAGRTLLSAVIGNVETRYTVQAVPAMEIVVMALLWYWWMRPPRNAPHV